MAEGPCLSIQQTSFERESVYTIHVTLIWEEPAWEVRVLMGNAFRPPLGTGASAVPSLDAVCVEQRRWCPRAIHV